MFGSKIRLILAGALFLAGFIAMALATNPRGPSLVERMESIKDQRLTQADMQARLAIVQRLEAKYQPHAVAFFWTASAEERETLKRAIDAEYAEAERIRARGPLAAFDVFLPALMAPHLIVLAFAAALALRPLVFVFAVVAVCGAMHQAFAGDFGVYVDSPSEYYLGAILAALALGAAAWLALAAWERRRLAPQ